MPRLWIVAGVLRPDLWAIALNLGGQGCINALAHDKVFAKAIILCRGRHHDRRGEHRLVDNATALVLFMTLPGLALFYGGLVRAENLLSVLMQCFAIACLVSVVWLLCAYSLTFSGPGPWIGDLEKALLLGVPRDAAAPNTSIPESVFFMFQMTFAIITPALIVGAFVERMRFGAVLLFTFLWLLLVYVPVAHWV